MFVITLVLLFIIRIRFPAGTPISTIIRKRYGDHVLKSYRKLETLIFKREKCILDKIFLNECKKNNLIPKFLRIKVGRDNRNAKLYRDFQRSLLDNEIGFKSKSIIRLEKAIQILSTDLNNLCNFFDFKHFLHTIDNLIGKKIDSVRKVHERKLFNLGVTLFEELDPKKVVFNFSSVKLSERLNYLLSKGLKFAIPTPRLKLSSFLLPFEKLLRSLKKHTPIYSHRSIKQVKSTIKSLAFSTYHSYHPVQCDNISKDDIKSLKNLSKRDDIVVCKPDKGQGVVILNKVDYVNKMIEILSDKSKFNEITVKDEKLVIKNEDQLNNFLRKLKKDEIIDENTYSMLFTTGSRPGILYGLPKIHKANTPLRPILSALGTINYKIAKYFIPLLRNITFNEYTLTDSFSFVDKIINIPNANNYYMASFDVVSLFTNVPLEETTNLIINKLFRESTHVNGLDKVNFRKLFEFATKDIVFYFNNKIYKQIEGVAMGSPLGPSLANIFMSHYEKIWLDDCPLSFKPAYYYRYVDDTFLLFKSKHHVQLFLDYLNAKHANIKFTSDVEKNNKLPFLDVNITRTNNEFTTAVYRKPTYTGLTTKYDSFTPHKYKSNLVTILIYRAFRLSKDYFTFHTDLEFITNILCKNGFPLNYVQRLTKQFLNKIFTTPKINVSTVPKDTIFVKLPFLGSSSYILKRKITELVIRHYTTVDVKFIFTNHNIGSFFNFKDKVPQTLRSMVVYRYECGSCNAAYLGKTSRNLFMRIHEHRGYSFRSTNLKLTKPMHSSIRQHCETSSHQFDINNFTIIDSADNNFDLSIKESLNIWNERPLLNDYSSSVDLELLK